MAKRKTGGEANIVVIDSKTPEPTIYKPKDREAIEGLPLPKPLVPMGPARQKWPRRKSK